MSSKEYGSVTIGGDPDHKIRSTGAHQARRRTPPPALEEGEKVALYGVFSTDIVTTVGTGTTKRKQVKQALWFAKELPPEDGERVVEVQPINDKNVPSGEKESLPLGDFLSDYTPQLEHYHAVVHPAMQEMDAILRQAEGQRDKGQYYSAQFGFEAALGFDERNVRANFGLGLTYMARGDLDKAADLFKSVVTLDAAFSPEHKHLFNEFGINLRKSKLFDQAVDYYSRALSMTDDDENLHYNIARAHYERGDKELCRDHLGKALEINPAFAAATDLLQHLNKQEQHLDQPLP